MNDNLQARVYAGFMRVGLLVSDVGPAKEGWINGKPFHPTGQNEELSRRIDKTG